MDSLNLTEALDQNSGQSGAPSWPQGQSGGTSTWPGQPNQPSWPSPAGNPSGGGGWPSPPSQSSGGGGGWPGQPGQPSQPSGGGWPGQPGQPSQPSGGGWPGQPGQPSQPSGGGGGWPGQPGQPSQPSQPGWSGPITPQQNLKIPFGQKLPNGVYDKLLITIGGEIKHNASMITVDLSAGSDLAFHFNPRFNDQGRKVIVRNSCISKKWGKEERDAQSFPFVQGQPFEMKILCTNSEFKVAVNGSHLLAFKHRITNLRSIQAIHIYYDLTLTKFNMETLP